MVEVVRCEYLHSSEYRSFTYLLCKEGLPLSQGVWWVEKVNGSVGVAYHLFCGNTYMGHVRKEDLCHQDVNEALWRLMKYVEGNMKTSDWSVLVFPHNWESTSWYNKSNEFVVMGGARAKRDWLHFMKQELGL